MKRIILVIVCALMAVPLRAGQKSPQTYTVELPPVPNFSSLDWLVGDWAGKLVGKEGGQVLLSVSYELDKHFMLLREEISLNATKNAPALHEGLLGIIIADPSGKGFGLNFYSSKGFVTHYGVTVNHGEIDFDPEGGAIPPPGVLFRRTMTHTNPGECVETVDAAPPKKPFFNYYTANLSQVTPQPPTAPTTPPPGPSQKSGKP
ncbi:MAG: hypothetical protein ACRD2B_02870 [Terriglobia bacterium]